MTLVTIMIMLAIGGAIFGTLFWLDGAPLLIIPIVAVGLPVVLSGIAFGVIELGRWNLR